MGAYKGSEKTIDNAIQDTKKLREYLHDFISLRRLIAVDITTAQAEKQLELMKKIEEAKETPCDKETFAPGDVAYVCCCRIPHSYITQVRVVIEARLLTVNRGVLYLVKTEAGAMYTFAENEVGEVLFKEEEEAKERIAKFEEMQREELLKNMSLSKSKNKCVIDPEKLIP